MWLWRGVICPEPGEHIRDTAAEAIELCRQYKADPKGKEYAGFPSQGYFEFVFNDVKLIVWADSTVEQIADDFEAEMERRRIESHDELRQWDKANKIGQ